MKLVSPRLRKLAAAFLLAAAAASISGQTKQPASASKTNQPPKKLRGDTIEFSGPASAPALPKPTARMDELKERFGVPESGASQPDLTAPIAPVNTPPSRAAVEKMWRDWDKKQNWLVPGAQGDPSDPSKAFARDEVETEENGIARRESVMEQYIHGRNSKKRDNKDRENNDETDRERRPEEGEIADSDFTNRQSMSAGDSAEPNGLADFNLGAYLKLGQQTILNSAGKDDLPRAFQPLRNDFGSLSRGPERTVEDREREAAHIAEFQQLLRPRASGGDSAFGSLRDPINTQPDLTRRDMNPVVPRPLESSPARASFAPAPAPRERMGPETAIFGMTGPSPSSLAPTFTPPPVAPTPVHRAPPTLIHEAPKRPF